MKNKTLMLYAFIIMLCFCFAQCKKTNTPDPGEQLPPETHIGAFTFGCKVDGKIYTAKGKGGLLATQSMYFNLRASDTSIAIGVSNSSSNNSFDLNIRLKYLGTPNIYFAKSYPYMATFQDNSNGSVPGNSNVYETDSINVGRINIKYLKGSSSPMEGIAGTFEMDAKNANGKVIRITEGRFDIGL